MVTFWRYLVRIFLTQETNDVEILRHEFERDGNSLRNWFQDGDIVLVDRGYRDAIPFLRLLGKIPASFSLDRTNLQPKMPMQRALLQNLDGS